MSTEELLEQFVTEVETMLERQKKYFNEPKDSPQKFTLLLPQSKAQEKKVREMIKNYRDAQSEKVYPSLFPD